MTLPVISIVTCSYNQARFLEATIRSVLAQDYPNVEYIIIDGGSTDGSVDLIRRYSDQLTYWISEPDGGQSDALNKGFRRCTGDLVGWQNSDDVYLPGAFSAAVDAFQRFDADVVFGNRLEIDRDGHRTGELRFTPFWLPGYRYEGMSVMNQSAFWRRSLFEEIGYLDPSLHVAMDYDFFLRAALAGKRFSFVHAALGALRRHEDSKEATIFATTEQHEREAVDARYFGRRTGARLIGLLSGARRTLYYLAQGDRDYVLSGITRRRAARRRRS
ncbi:MAG TPA: glycosyltransferase family 2 protein [Actinomycetota bacterium]|nr:glycosyltransferase family 2 protein [Actinomycetota bacterium]